MNQYTQHSYMHAYHTGMIHSKCLPYSTNIHCWQVRCFQFVSNGNSLRRRVVLKVQNISTHQWLTGTSNAFCILVDFINDAYSLKQIPRWNLPHLIRSKHWIIHSRLFQKTYRPKLVVRINFITTICVFKLNTRTLEKNDAVVFVRWKITK